MKTTQTSQKIETITTAQAIANLTPRQTLSKKDFPTFDKHLQAVLTAVYAIYRARQASTSTTEDESKAMTIVTDFLHTLGKVNGKYISVMESTTDETKKPYFFFDLLVYHSFAKKIYTTSAELASLENERKNASQAKRKAFQALTDGTGTTDEYQKAVKKYQALTKKIKALQALEGNENDRQQMASLATFKRFVIDSLRMIIDKKMALDPEEVERERKQKNHDKRQAKKAKAKPTETTAKQGKKKPSTTKKKPSTKKGKNEVEAVTVTEQKTA